MAIGFSGHLAVEAVFLQDLVLVLDDLIPHRQLHRHTQAQRQGRLAAVYLSIYLYVYLYM